MENWKSVYQSRLVTADEAVTHIPNNSRVLIGHAANQPPALVEAMCRNYRQYENVQRLYDFVNNNPDVEVLPVDHVNDPWVIGQNSKMVSINSCLQVDFNGQVNSESMGTQQFSGVGGQLDYIRGSFLSPGGKAILAMPSTAKKGTFSRIVPVFEAGTTVTTPRTDTHYIVTEYGIANLRGKSLRERAKLLIGIAHPKFHEELWAAYKERYGEDENFLSRS